MAIRINNASDLFPLAYGQNDPTVIYGDSDFTVKTVQGELIGSGATKASAYEDAADYIFDYERGYILAGNTSFKHKPIGPFIGPR